MKAIIVDDEPLSISRFERISKKIPELNMVGSFSSPLEAYDFAKNHNVEIAFVDVEMPIMNGIELAMKLRELSPNIIIVFISAHEGYIKESNRMGGDYYIVKPFEEKVIKLAMDRINLLAQRQDKELYIRTFGTFSVLKDGVPIPLVGKAKEILALIVTYRGKEVSNQTIYSTLWENRPYGNDEMVVFFNALRRLRTTLKNEGLDSLLISTKRGQMVNTRMFDCDYYAWIDNNAKSRDRFEGEFLTEYSWAEEKLADLIYNW